MSENDIHSSNDHADLPADAPVEMPLPRLPRPPFWMISIALVAVVASWLPLVLGALARTNRSSSPRISLLHDMGVQPKYREQQTSPIFEDGRAMRPAVAGTVARGHLDVDDHYFRGFQQKHNDASGKDENVFFTDFPKQVTINEALLQRGQQRFNIYCSACHGVDGRGHGAVNERALELMEEGAKGMLWVQAASLHDVVVRGRENGNLFNTITNGVRNMPGYANQIPVDDRWAIVAYVRALQLSQNAPKTVLTQEQLGQLK